jgi:hypothetical protein
VWRAVAEFAGRRSERVSFSIENVAILREIDAEFVFSSPLVLDDRDATATLRVRNRSSEIIRFVELGQNQSNVNVDLDRSDGVGWSSSFFIPSAVLTDGKAIVPMISLRLTWASLKFYPSVSVAPGAVYERRLPMAASIERGQPPVPSGEYSVRFSTALEILPGEPDGQWKDLVPLRLEVSSTVTGRRR